MPFENVFEKWRIYWVVSVDGYLFPLIPIKRQFFKVFTHKLVMVKN